MCKYLHTKGSTSGDLPVISLSSALDGCTHRNSTKELKIIHCVDLARAMLRGLLPSANGHPILDNNMIADSSLSRHFFSLFFREFSQFFFVNFFSSFTSLGSVSLSLFCWPLLSLTYHLTESRLVYHLCRCTCTKMTLFFRGRGFSF
jgi:hypothetical protein